MIRLVEAFSPDDADLLVALDGFLRHCGVPEDRYALVPAGPSGLPASVDVVLRYGLAPLHGTMDAEVEWRRDGGSGRIAIQLAAGIRFVAMILGDPFGQGPMPEATVGPRDALTRVGLPYLDTWIPDPAMARPNQTFLAPYEGGFTHGFMDVRPPAQLIAWSRQASAVAWEIAASKAGTKADVASALAEFLP